MSSRVQTVAGVEVPVDVQGEGPVVVLVPGGAATSVGYWGALPEALAELATVVQLDRPGTGRSAVVESLRLETQVEHLAAVIETVGGGPAVLVGHSLGGPVTLQLALDRPDLVAGIVQLDPAPITEPKLITTITRTYAVFAWAERTRLPVGPLFLKAVRAGLTRSMVRQDERRGRDGSAARDFVETTFAHQQWTQLDRILEHLADDGARLVERLRSEQPHLDGVVVASDRKQSQAAHRANVELAGLAGLELQTWEGTSHSVHLDEPQRTVELVRAQLSSSVA